MWSKLSRKSFDLGSSNHSLVTVIVWVFALGGRNLILEASETHRSNELKACKNVLQDAAFELVACIQICIQILCENDWPNH